MVVEAKTINSSDFNESVEPKIESWNTSEFYTKKGMKCANIVNADGTEIAIISSVMEVAFDVKPSQYNENKLSFPVKFEEDNDMYELGFNYLSKKMTKLTIENINKLPYEEEEDEEMTNEMISAKMKSPFNHKEPYKPMVNFKIEDDKYKGILKDENILIDENSEKIKNPDYTKELVRGTKVQVIFTLDRVIFQDTEFRPIMKIVKIKIIERAKPYVKTYINNDNYEDNKIEITVKDTNDKGGSFSKLKYKLEDSSVQLAIELKDSRLNPWAFERVNENTGKLEQSISVSANNDCKSLFNKIDNNISSFITENIKDINSDIHDSVFKEKKHAKKSERMKNTILTKSIKEKLKPILQYSKTDKELIKKGEEPKYNPSINISTYKYNDTFAFNFLDKDGNKLDADDFGEYKASHPDTHYDIKCFVKHLWYGKTYSIKLMIDEIKISSSSAGSFKYKFGDEGDDSEDNGGPAEEEPATEAVSPKEQEEDDAPSDSDEDSEDDDSE